MSTKRFVYIFLAFFVNKCYNSCVEENMNPYIPEKLPIKNIDLTRLANKLENASSNVYRYDGMLNNFVNPDILLSPLIRKEGDMSSRIEGTQSTMSDVLKFESGQKFEEKQEREIIGIRNYRYALKFGEQYISEGRKISLSLLKELHQSLMKGAKWDSRSIPGNFREEQVFIAPQGQTIENASYIPPEHLLVKEYLENWQEYLSEENINKLIQAAVMHAQFEIIHPFVDGNGRIGRMLIPLYLFQVGVLQKPVLYISEYFEQNRDEYYRRLRNITLNNEWTEWIEFFLTAIAVQAKNNIVKAKKISVLYEEMKAKFQKLINSRYNIAALDTLFKNPIINVNRFSEKSNIKIYTTARSIIKKLEKSNLIIKLQEGKGRTSAFYAFPALLNIIDENL